MLSFLVKKESEHATSAWSGGTTTELYLYPGTATYAGRDFGFRVSSATVQLESSKFTSLPGFRRHIMPLTGRLHLEHDGHHTARLEPYQVDCFDGAWQTESFGICTDFNLMCAEGFWGDMYALDQPGKISCESSGFTGVYTQAERLEVCCIQGRDKKFDAVLERGDFLLVQCDGEQGPVMEISGVTADSPAVILTVQTNHP